jgi:hypothetical protein
MFEPIEDPPNRFTGLLLHSFLVVVVVPIVGLLNYWTTPFAGGALALYTARGRHARGALFAWIPAFLLFAWDATSTITTWGPSWSHMTRWEYLMNYLFGPNCGSSECLGMVVSAVFTGGIGYSLAAYFVLKKKGATSSTKPEIH